jgi:RNA polymerase-interacting CarD/CdnL/TRCF family regulator
MNFHIGDKVIHCSFGLGEITKIEEMIINGHTTTCYVVQITDMTVWIPVDDNQHNSLRLPATPEEFSRVLPILSSPNEALQEDRLLRKQHLIEQLSDGQLSSICRLIRDLTHLKRSAKLSDQEKSILERAIKTLVAEWSLSLGIPQIQAYQSMESLLLN